MISINTNNGGLFAAKAASQSQATIDSAMQRLSTGSRINNAKDDAAGQAIATRLTAEIQGLEIASRNVADGQSLVDTAEGALQETHTLLLRMREIGVQAANGTLSTSDNQALDAEFQQLVKEIDRIAQNTTWAGAALLNGDGGTVDTSETFSFQAGVGNNSGADVFSVTVKNADATTLDVFVANGSDATVNDVNLLSQTSAGSAITAVDAAIATVSSERANLGAVSNRMASTMANLDQIRVNLTASKGRIADADFAAETANLAKGQILQQAATAMLAQANASKQQVLTLIR
ncbi:flagellin [Paracoccaceae bacterium]|nr:flagellin [Paracoccaceae bacterium]